MNNDKKIRLFIFIPTLECGGSEKYVSLLCGHLDKNKFEITLVVLDNSRPFYAVKNNAVHVIDLKVKHVRRSLFPIRKVIKEGRPDIVFTAANHLNLLFAIFRGLFPKRIRLIAWESSIVSINSRRAKFHLLYNGLLKIFYRRLDFIICQSAFMERDLVSNYAVAEDRTAVIHSPVEDMTRGETGLRAKEDPPKKYQFITIARLSEEKGIDRLIRAVARLSVPFQYHIIGEGNERERLEQLIGQSSLQDKVFLEGEKKEPWAGHENADLVLMGSRYEGFPNVLLEAGALGIPVVAFDAPGGIGEIITDSENGLLVKDNDEPAFAVTVENALQMNFDRNKIIADTRERYGMNMIMNKVEDLLLQLSPHKDDSE